MENLHKFHIPVLGIGYSIDTALKVARFGIDSTLSLVSDSLIEDMRNYYQGTYAGSRKVGISAKSDDFRARRITAYLDILDSMCRKQFEELKNQIVTRASDVMKYFYLLPKESVLRGDFFSWFEKSEKRKNIILLEWIKKRMVMGSIDVNIMSKLDRDIYDENGEKIPESSDALSALRGFAKSTLESSIVLSAGFNPRLCTYFQKFKDFYPDKNGNIKKKVIIKVGDYKSALIQGKVFAKKGILVSEFRIESGINCGGHVFPTSGQAIGLVTEEFKEKREELSEMLFNLTNKTFRKNDIEPLKKNPHLRITVQGGVSTSAEQKFLIEHCGMDSVGWGTPFLLVPEAVNVSGQGLTALIQAKREDVYISDVSPVTAFSTLRTCESEKNRNGKASVCPVKHLVNNTDYSSKPICTASKGYRQVNKRSNPKASNNKACLCMELSKCAYNSKGINQKGDYPEIVCPGITIANFDKEYSLKKMVSHIYGRININTNPNASMFFDELILYIEYLDEKIKKFALTEEGPEKIKARKNVSQLGIQIGKGFEYYCDNTHLFE